MPNEPAPAETPRPFEPPTRDLHFDPHGIQLLQSVPDDLPQPWHRDRPGRNRAVQNYKETRSFNEILHSKRPSYGNPLGQLSLHVLGQCLHRLVPIELDTREALRIPPRFNSKEQLLFHVSRLLHNAVILLRAPPA